MESKWLGTLRGRLGIAFGSWLPYATGGLAARRVSYSDFGFFSIPPLEQFGICSGDARRLDSWEEESSGNLPHVGA